jgi:transcription-repair coupling factor (superfamily II helicase)
VTFAQSGFPSIDGLLGYVQRLKGAAKLRPDSKLVITRDWPTPEARLNGALQLSTGLARVATASERTKEPVAA